MTAFGAGQCSNQRYPIAVYVEAAWCAAFSTTITASQGDEEEHEKLLATIRESRKVAAIAARLEKDEGTRPSA